MRKTKNIFLIVITIFLIITCMSVVSANAPVGAEGMKNDNKIYLDASDSINNGDLDTTTTYFYEIADNSTATGSIIDSDSITGFNFASDGTYEITLTAPTLLTETDYTVYIYDTSTMTDTDLCGIAPFTVTIGTISRAYGVANDDKVYLEANLPDGSYDVVIEDDDSTPTTYTLTVAFADGKGVFVMNSPQIGRAHV